MSESSEVVVWGVGTPRTLRVHWALAELGLPYETVPIETRTEAMEEADFLAVSPGRKIPALQHGELNLTESGAITAYLMDTFGTAELSDHERANMYRWKLFALTEIDATALYVIRRHEGLPAIYGEAPEAIRSSYEYAYRQINVVEQALTTSGYIVGDTFTEADIHLGSCFEWATLVKMSLPTKANAYLSRLRERPAYQAAMIANRPPGGYKI